MSLHTINMIEVIAFKLDHILLSTVDKLLKAYDAFLLTSKSLGRRLLLGNFSGVTKNIFHDRHVKVLFD